jgi:hypothetical protein
MNEHIRTDHRERAASVCVRQSSLQPPLSPRRSTTIVRLADRGGQLGFVRVVVIGDDWGTSGSQRQRCPGVGRRLSAVWAGAVGAVFALVARSLARTVATGITGSTAVA